MTGEVDVDLDHRVTPKRKRPIVLHWTVPVPADSMREDFPQFDLIPGRALCGFVFTTSNRVTMLERATEGEVPCRRCQEIFLEIQFAWS